MKKRLIILSLLILGLIGFLLSVHLTRQHYSFMAGQREGNTYCNISSKFNCDAVTVSPYSQISLVH
jgi:uncharacterized membrane protein